MGWGNWGRFPAYVSKAEKIKRSEKSKADLMKKALKKGERIEPVSVPGREISKTWWGKTWVKNLERYADFENRLPRGRSYLRNGSVLDLKIASTSISALVSGSQARPYVVKVTLQPSDTKTRLLLMEKGKASLDSMQSLLSGEFPLELKEAFFEKTSGLFPTPKELKFSCSCPDWADLCKHVAAALYGTAVRLDEKPELFFSLRGIKIEDFVGNMVKVESDKMLKKASATSARVIKSEGQDLSNLFGITMDEEAKKLPAVLKHAVIQGKKKAKKTTPTSKNSKRPKIIKPTKKSLKNSKPVAGKGKSVVDFVINEKRFIQ